jgi:nucleoside-diphosphate-sugar epimerase
MGRNYLEHRIQFVHVDDMARLIAHILRIQNPAPQRLTVLNVAGRGEPLTFGRCIEIAQARLLRIPTRWAFGLALQFLWKMGISAVPPEAEPYIAGEYIVDTSKLRSFLGNDYEKVIQFTVEEAFADCFQAAGSGSRAGALT